MTCIKNGKIRRLSAINPDKDKSGNKNKFGNELIQDTKELGTKTLLKKNISQINKYENINNSSFR